MDEAREIYHRSSGIKDSDKRSFALQEWNKFYLPVVEKIIKENEVVSFFKIFTSGNMPPSGKAKDVAVAVLDRFVLMISTPQEGRTIYKLFPDNHGCVKGGYAVGVTARWDKLSLLEVENANGIPEIRAAVENAFYNRGPFIKGMLRWAGFCRTVDEIIELLDYAKERSSYKEEINSSITEALRKKKISILLLETPKVKDIQTIKSYYCLAPAKSAVEIFIFEKWLDLCTTPEEANEAFSNAPEGKVVCQIEAYKKVRDLAMSTT